MADLSFGPRFVVPSEHVGAPVGKPAGERSATSDAASPGLLSVATTSAGARPDSSHLSTIEKRPETNRRGRRQLRLRKKGSQGTSCGVRQEDKTSPGLSQPSDPHPGEVAKRTNKRTPWLGEARA